jgi:hypothetical protein
MRDPGAIPPEEGAEKGEGGGTPPRRPATLAAVRHTASPRHTQPHLGTTRARRRDRKSPWYGGGAAGRLGCAAQTLFAFRTKKVSGWRAFAAREPLRGTFTLSSVGRYYKRGTKSAHTVCRELNRDSSEQCRFSPSYQESGGWFNVGTAVFSGPAVNVNHHPPKGALVRPAPLMAKCKPGTAMEGLRPASRS